MQTSPSSKLDYQRIKNFKYLVQPIPEKHNKTIDSDIEKKDPWKASHPK